MFSALLVFHDLTMKVSSCIDSTFCSAPALPCLIPTNTYTLMAVLDLLVIITLYLLKISVLELTVWPKLIRICGNLWSSCLGLVGAEKIIGLQSLSPVHYLILVICNKNSSY